MICTLLNTKYLVEREITRLEAKEDLNDKKGERVERMDEWMNKKCHGVPIYRYIGDLLEEMCL